MDWLSLISSLLSGGVSLFNNIWNTDQQNKTNQANRDYATAMTTAQWERDDSSLQRQVADAKASGLSPLAVTGSMNSSSPVVMPAQAPQMDLSGLLGAIMQMPSNQIARDTLNQNERHHAEDLSFQVASSQIELQKFKDDLEQRQIEHKDEILQFVDNLDYQYTVLTQTVRTDQGNISSQNAERLLKVQQQSLEEYKNLCNVLGIPPETKYYTDWNAYINALNSWTPLLATISGQSDVTSTSTSTSESTSYGGAVSINLPTKSSSSSTSKSEDMTRSHSYSMLPAEPFPLFKLSPDDAKASRGSASFARTKHTWSYD